MRQLLYIREQTNHKKLVVNYYTNYILNILSLYYRGGGVAPPTTDSTKLRLINEDIYCEKKKLKESIFPLLGRALILWWCIQHSDVITKSHLILPDPIKKAKMTAAILMCDCMALSTPPGECPRKHNFALNWGLCGLFPRREEKTYNFIHVSGIPHISFWCSRKKAESVGVMKLELKRNA